MKLADCLPQGKENAVPGRYLVQLLELNGPRELTPLVERARRDGIPICASTSVNGPGYYLSESPEELAAYIKSLDRRLHNVGKTRCHLEATLLKMTGQETIGGC